MRKCKKILFGVLAIMASAMLSAGIAACDDKDEKTLSSLSTATETSSNTQNDGSSSLSNTENENSDTTSENDSSTESSSESSDAPKEENQIRFKTFTVDGDNVFAPQAFSNATTEFSFLEEIEVSGKSTFEVAIDKFGINTSLTKTVPLQEGDNTFYVFEMQDGVVVHTYTVTVRRRPIYRVYFNANGGTAVEAQTVEEDACASAPTSATTRAGYTFDKWDYDFTQPITNYTTVNAVWTANTDTPYKVEYYLQNIENYECTLAETVNKTGTTDTTANAEIKTFDHFTYSAGWTDSGNINGDGSTVLKVYYTRDTYTVTFDGNGGEFSWYEVNSSNGNVMKTVRYGDTVVAPTTCAKTGYTFDDWDKPLTNIAEDQTITAQWIVNQYTLTIVFGNGEEDKTITQDYDTPIEYTLPTDLERGGYGFNGWNFTLPATMPARDLTITANWVAFFEHSEGKITDLTWAASYGENKITELKIPAEIDGEKITAIGDSAFSGRSSLTSIEIPDSVTSIGDSAFSGCDSLTSIEIPNGVTSISALAFGACRCLTIYCEAASQPSGWNNRWNGGEELCSVVWNCKNNDVADDGYIYTVIDSIRYAIKDGEATVVNQPRNNIQTAIIPASIMYKNATYAVTSIGQYAFYDCSRLTSVVIGDSVTSIGSSAFFGCSSLTSVVIGNSVTSIGESAFYDCSRLTKVYYNGTESEWNGISVYSYGNGYLTSATRYYYSETQPTATGNYWHYDVSGSIAVW